MSITLAAAWDRRIEAGAARLPDRVRKVLDWLRADGRRPIRLVFACLFILGGIFSILPVLGLWMLPVGLALLAEDVPGLKPVLERGARWCERLWARLRRRTPDA